MITDFAVQSIVGYDSPYYGYYYCLCCCPVVTIVIIGSFLFLTIILQCSTCFQDASLLYSCSESPSVWSLSYSLCKGFRISCLALHKDFPLSSLLYSLIFKSIFLSFWSLLSRLVFLSLLFFLLSSELSVSLFSSHPLRLSENFYPLPLRWYLRPCVFFYGLNLDSGSLYCSFWTESSALLLVDLPLSFCKPENGPS